MFKDLKFSTYVLAGLCVLAILLCLLVPSASFQQVAGAAAVGCLGGALWTMRDKLSGKKPPAPPTI